MNAALSRTESITHELRDEILRGTYAPGERLPAERELAARLGVNRGSLREALKKLEQMGLVVIRRGDGTIVKHLHEAGVEVVRHLLLVDGELNRPLVAQLLDVQEMLVVGSTHLAVERGSDADVARARQLVQRLGSVHSNPVELMALIDEIVEQLTSASENLVLRLFRNTVRPVLAGRIRAPQQLLGERGAFLVACASEIDAGLAARDPVATSEAVRGLVRERRRRIEEVLDSLENDPTRPHGPEPDATSHN